MKLLILLFLIPLLHFAAADIIGSLPLRGILTHSTEGSSCVAFTGDPFPVAGFLQEVHFYARNTSLMQMLLMVPEINVLGQGNAVSYMVTAQLFTTLEEAVDKYAFHSRVYKAGVLAVCLKDASVLQYSNTVDDSGRYNVVTFTYTERLYPGKIIENVHTEAKPRVYGVLAVYSPQ